MRIVAALVLSFLAPAAWAEGPGGTPPVAIRTTPVEITGGDLNGVELLSAHVLAADAAGFGGFSGLVIQNGHMIAVSDTGWWLLADLIDDSAGLRPGRAGFLRMQDSDGSTYSKRGGDAEGLTVREGGLVVSFERDHRLMFHLEEGMLGDDLRDPGFGEMSSNKGLEALATTPEGWLLAIGEAPLEGGFPMFLIRWSGEIERRALPAISRHFVTGADVGPDGKLYLLLRDYTPIIGVSIRIHRYGLGEDGLPDPESREILASFGSSSGIDNMEGIALWTDDAGGMRMTLISDDNYSPLQRTLMMDFRVNP